MPLLLPPQLRRPRRQLEQRHLRRQRLVQDGGDDVGRQSGQVDYAAYIAVVDAFTPGSFMDFASPEVVNHYCYSSAES